MAFGNTSKRGRGGQQIVATPKRVESIPSAPRPGRVPGSQMQSLDDQFALAQEQIREGFERIRRDLDNFSPPGTGETRVYPVSASDFFEWSEEEMEDERRNNRTPELTLGGRLLARGIFLGLGIVAFIVIGKMIMWAWSIDL